MKIKRKMIKRLMPVPVQVRHAEYSMVFSADDDASRPSEVLLSVALEAIEKARGLSLADLSARMKGPPYYPEIWPGEHYKLLAGLALSLKPKMVIEIGTGSGLSALAIKKYLSPGSKIATFDLVDWKSYPGSCLREEDFRDGSLVQHLDDLSNPDMVLKHRQIITEAEMIIIDAEKDGVMEQRFLDNFSSVSFRTSPLVFFDDIRLWNMLKIWRNIAFPKLDLTSFGHWSGTGIIEWKKSGAGQQKQAE